MFSDISTVTYEAAGHNVWDEDQPNDATRSFYGAARELAHAQLLHRYPAPRSGGRLLDVGCGLGYFMARASRAGWTAYGCDTSEHWLEHAALLTGTPERLVRTGPQAELFGGGFDLITAWDVLEHVHDPLPFLRAIARLLAPGGRVFVRTPNLAWVYPTYAVRRHMLGSDVELGPLNHVVYYSPRTLALALHAAGLEPVAWPVLPPPQVGIANRRPDTAGQRSITTRIKNLHAAVADRASRASGGRLVIGADLDVVAVSRP
jgi:2-polyprenyl-3-methyl-5-hydroxy-6-metoxy-1,4-benzoquinol methylase